jgi:cytochrome b561
MANRGDYDIPIYSGAARGFHWLIVLLLLLQIPGGFYMMYRAEEMPGLNDKGEAVKGVWNGVADGGFTDTLFSGHKLFGLLILLIVALRFLYRVTQGAPRSDPTVPPALTGIGHLVHWGLYALMFATPILGYLAISYGRFLDVFGLVLPAVTGEDKKFSEEVFEWHEMAAILLLVLAALHVAGAIYHRVIRKDRVVERMLPKRTV